MTSFTLLHRIDSEMKEKRFYAVVVQPSLFDLHAVIRVWGRIGGWQRMLIRPFSVPEEAEKFAARLINRRLNHGYQIVDFPEKK